MLYIYFHLSISFHLYSFSFFSLCFSSWDFLAKGIGKGFLTDFFLSQIPSLALRTENSYNVACDFCQILLENRMQCCNLIMTDTNIYDDSRISCNESPKSDFQISISTKSLIFLNFGARQFTPVWKFRDQTLEIRASEIFKIPRRGKNNDEKIVQNGHYFRRIKSKKGWEIWKKSRKEVKVRKVKIKGPPLKRQFGTSKTRVGGRELNEN